jgi:hypothetical protein
MRGDSRRFGWPSEPPGLDCLGDGHILVSNEQPGAWFTEDGSVPWASWCLYCGGGVSNEDLP